MGKRTGLMSGLGRFGADRFIQAEMIDKIFHLRPA
jgi:hypothetical protein